jgi:hypothetical protein
METITTVSERSHPKPRISGKSKEELAKIAYGAVEGIEFLEMNDGTRLGYHVYLYLNGELLSIADAIYEAKARAALDPGKLEQTIMERLVAAGVPRS